MLYNLKKLDDDAAIEKFDTMKRMTQMTHVCDYLNTYSQHIKG